METAQSAWRRKWPVLVAEAQAIGSIGVIRSLGRAGYPVHACASKSDALGFSSKYVRAIAKCPGYFDAAYLAWLRSYVKVNEIQAIIPSESLLLAIRPVFHEFARLLPIPSDPDTVYAGMSKFDLFESFLKSPADLRVRENLPPCLLVSDMRSGPGVDELARLGTPLFVKTDGSYAEDPETEGAVFKCGSPAEARELLNQLSSKFRKALIQGHVRGQGVGAFFLLWDGKPIAEFMHRRLHEVPHTGGVSSLRESWFHSAIHDDALRKVKFLDWRGVAMMEYRWDSKTDQFYLMEMNGRFWGSLHLALHAGVDFPVLLLDAFHGRVPTAPPHYRQHVYCRYTVPKEIEYVWSRLKDSQLSWSSRLGAVWEFFKLSADPRIYSDLLFPGDRGLYWRGLKRFARVQFQGRRVSKTPA